MKPSDYLSRAWRWLEGLHTLEWLYSLAPSGVVALFGLYTGVQWYWVLLGIPILAAALFVLGQAIFGRLGFMPLSKAAQVAFEQLPDTIWRVGAQRFEATAEGRLDWVATRLSMDIPIYGRVPPSRQVELIPTREVRTGHICDGATTLKHWGDPGPAFVDLAIRRKDLRPVIRAMRDGDPTRSG